MKKYILLLGLAGLMACGSKEQATDPFPEATEVIPVKVIPVESRPIPEVIEATGLVSTENAVRYSFKVGGIIDKILVDEGEYFPKGKLLATLKINEIDAQKTQAQLGFEKAKRDYDRVSSLYTDSVATLEQLQDARTGMEVAQKSLEVVSFNQQYTRIYAAAPGFVARKLANEGEIVGAGMPLLAVNEAGAGQDWLLTVSVTDREWSALEVGQRAEVTLDAWPDTPIPASVHRKSQTADPVSGAFPVELTLNLSGKTPAMGMFGKAQIFPQKEHAAPVVPFGAIMEANGNQGFVFIPNGKQGVEKRPVQIAAFDADQVYIQSGLEQVEEIIVSNSAFLNENSRIQIIP